MGWRKAENSDSVKPAIIDKVSSRKYVFIRKDFEEVPTLDESGEQVGTHWEYYEKRILKEDWETYEQVMENTNDIATLEDAICDLTMGE